MWGQPHWPAGRGLKSATRLIDVVQRYVVGRMWWGSWKFVKRLNEHNLVALHVV